MGTTKQAKVLQFGEGNFLRAFVDWMIEKANQKLNLDMGVVIVQPIAKGMVEAIKAQNCSYNVILEGIQHAKPIREIQKVNCVIDAINPYQEYQKYRNYFLNPELEFVISNTTEAGISRIDNEDIFAEPPISFPGKITQLLYQRYKNFNGATDKGLTFIACELIENNASVLQDIVLELASENELEPEFSRWVNTTCTFCNSLVDRIVTGFPKENIQQLHEELGEKDNVLVTAEYFHLWAIEGGPKVQEAFPLQKAGLNIVWLDKLKAFRDKKVRILNGAHTALVPVGLLSGHETVKQAFGDKNIENYIRSLIAEEVLPNIEGNTDELKVFADEILERFYNPYLKHYLKDISLNSISKWITRDYPSLVDSLKREGAVPKRLSFSLAALIVLYLQPEPIKFEARDDEKALLLMKNIWGAHSNMQDKIQALLSEKKIWSIKLNEVNGLVQAVSDYTESILTSGIGVALKKLNETC